MRILIHSETGTRHIPTDNHKHQSLCGYNGVNPNIKDVWDIGKSNHLDDFPQDFGDLPSDCNKCAKKFNK